MSDTTALGHLPGTRQQAPAAAESGEPMTTKVVSGSDGLNAHVWEWRDLAAAARGKTVFQTPEFTGIWQTAFVGADTNRFHSVLVYDGDTLVALIPIVLRRIGPLRIARLAGFPIGQYDDILIRPAGDPGKVLEALVQAIRTNTGADILTFDNVRSDSALGAACRDVAIRIGRSEKAPFAEFGNGDPVAFTDGLKKRVRKHLVKCRRDLESLGRTEFAVARSADAARNWMEEALRLKRQWLCDTGRISRAFMNSKSDGCLVAAAGDLCTVPGPVRTIVSRLSVDGQTAAIEFGFVHRNIYHAYLGAFAPQFARHSPGNLLTENLLGALAEFGVSHYDMLAPDSRYKREWSTGAAVVDNYAIGMSWPGAIYLRLVGQAIAPAARWGFYRLPVGLRGLLACRLNGA